MSGYFNGENRRDFDFYARYLEQTRSNGPALEIGCGNGDLLVAYRCFGFAVDGIDHDAAVVKVCQENLLKNNVSAEIVHQAMQHLTLSKKYALIYVPAGIFMHLIDLDEAIKTVLRFYEHLISEGVLIISLYIPLNELLVGVEPATWRIVLQNQKQGFDEVVEESVHYEPIRQVRTLYRRISRLEDGNVIQQRVVASAWRWYGIHEITLLLQSLGFTCEALCGDYTHNPVDEESILFTVTARKKEKRPTF